MSTAKSSTPGVLIISVYDIDTAQQGLFAHFFLLSPTSIHHTLFIKKHTLFLFFFFSDPCYADPCNPDQSLGFFSRSCHSRPKRMFTLPQNFPLIILSCLTNHYRIMIILFAKEVIFGLGPWSLKRKTQPIWLKRWLISCSWMTRGSSLWRGPPRWNQIGVLSLPAKLFFLHSQIFSNFFSVLLLKRHIWYLSTRAYICDKMAKMSQYRPKI